jgi:hypothetical protein
LSALGFFDGVHYIGTDFLHVFEDAASVRDAFLRGDPMMMRTVSNAALKVSQEHTTAVRTIQIHHICMENITYES